MPCYDSRNDPSYIASEYRKDIDNLTRMLCGLCSHCETATHPHLIELVPNLGTWWKNHQEADRKRIANMKKLKAENNARKEKEFNKLAKELGKKIV